jgi:hypothetical protein
MDSTTKFRRGVKMEKRYAALRIIGTVYKVLGGITGVITLLLVITICGSSVLGGAALDSLSRDFGADGGIGGLFSGILGGLILSVVTIIYGGATAVTLFALGEGVYLLLALEENTRTTSLLLERQTNLR